MTDPYFWLRLAHIVGATVLFGTGLGVAFFMLMAHLTRDAAHIARTARTVVIADTIFTATAAVVQPLTGLGLVWWVGYSPFDSWIVVSLALYVFVGLCWLPVVWIQIRLRDLAAASLRDGAPLPPAYDRLFRLWFALGWPAFAAMVAIFMLMIWKPALW